jgi:hypothetical protein
LNKKIIIVGNSCSLLDIKNGSKIDDFDYVVRMGGFPRIKGYECFVGTKTDMYCMKWFKFFEVEKGISDHCFGAKRENFEIEYNDILCLSHDPDYFTEIAPVFQRYERNSLNRSFYYPIGNRYLHDFAIHDFSLQNKRWYFFNSIDMQTLVQCLQKQQSNIRYSNGIEPTSGLCVIWYFINRFKDCEITVTGFDGFKTGHYWKPNINTFFQSHNGTGEWLFIKSLVKKGAINIL